MFSEQVEKARNDELKHWENEPKATLALIILQDQFLRSLYKVCNKYRVTDRLIYQPNELIGDKGTNGRKYVGMHVRTNRQINERTTNNQTNERTKERMKARTNERTKERRNERTNERTNEYTYEGTHSRTYVLMKERKNNEPTNERTNEES